jgi:hypothetical protein
MKIFSGKKYFSLILVIMILGLGFALMAGPENDPNIFNPDIFDFTRISLAPIFVLSAYVCLFIVILKKRDF